MAKPNSTTTAPSKNVEHIFDFVRRPPPTKWPPICVFYGPDVFFQQLALTHLRSGAGASREFPDEVRFEGQAVEFHRVADELRSASLFGDERCLVLVQDADKFISDHRTLLERYLEQPGPKTLVLQSVSWLKTTRLHQRLLEQGLIVDCSVPARQYGTSTVVDRKALSKWFVGWAPTAYGSPIKPQTMEYLIDLVGPEPGIIDQELRKLSTLVSSGKEITKGDVDRIGSGWRLRTTWEVLDAILDGKADLALQQFHRLIQAGEEPIAFFGALAWFLRRFAAAAAHSDWTARTMGRRDIPTSLRAAGFRDDFGSQRPAKAEAQLRQLGYERCIKLSARLIEIDLQLKGSHSAMPHARRVLEELIVELSARLRPGNKAPVRSSPDPAVALNQTDA